MKNRMKTKHEFSLYDENLSARLFIDKTYIKIDQKDPLFHRIKQVLRLRIGDTFFLFDTAIFVHIALVSYDKNDTICGTVLSVQNQRSLNPIVRAVVPLLKRDETETMVYGLCEMGVTEIVLVKTERTQREWHGEREKERLMRICIAAAEQTQQCSIPTLIGPVQFMQISISVNDSKKAIFCDPLGGQIADVVSSKTVEEVTIFVGPESDLSDTEKQFLYQHSVSFCRLTPTILRACHAAILAVGIIRTLCNQK